MPSAEAQQTRQPAVESAAALEGGTRTGFVTERLSPRQLKLWKSIERIALAEDRTGQPLHPRLHGLWHWAEAGGHAIYVELLDRKNPAIYHAGTFAVEKSGPAGQNQIAVLRLYLWIIDEASVGREVARPDGFIPFKGLGKNERYAQVVGHELAHAALILEDANYAHQYQELDREAANFLLLRQKSRIGDAYDQATEQVLSRLQSLTMEVEKPAQAAEVEIWRELLDGQRTKAAVRSY
jgi:hypothetical protein